MIGCLIFGSLAAMGIARAIHHRRFFGGCPGLLAERRQEGALLLGQFVEVLENTLDRAVLLQQPGGGLLADAPHAGDVVRGVADEALVVRDLIGAQAIALVDGRLVVAGDVVGATARRQHADRGRDQLHGVEVAGDDQGLGTGGGCLAGQRADDVVGLEALDLVDGDAEGVDHLVHALELLRQRLGHRRPVGLVGGEALVAEGGRGEVEGDGPVRGLLGLQRLEQDGGEAVDGIGELAARGGELLAQGVKGAVHDGVAVDHHELLGDGATSGPGSCTRTARAA